MGYAGIVTDVVSIPSVFLPSERYYVIAALLTAVTIATSIPGAVTGYAKHLDASSSRLQTQADAHAEQVHREWHEEQERKAAEEAKRAAAQPAVSNQGMWEAIAQCESGGDWSVNTGNGYYGGLQFNKQSWDWAGGNQYAAYPHQATKAQQIATANRLRAIHPAGLGAWPACTKKLGLR